MIKIENTEVFGWEAAVRGMRNPKNSWDKSDSLWTNGYLDDDHVTVQYAGDYDEYQVGQNDLKLMKTLAKAGSDHGKFLRMINVTCDITAPLYWWKEFDTYKVGTVANSCSTMHKIAAKPFTLDDFSHEHLFTSTGKYGDSLDVLEAVIATMNYWRERFIVADRIEDDVEGGFEHKKNMWWQMIQLLPSSYNQKRTVQLNYEVLRAMDRPGRRRDHKLDEWREFCKWAETLPYFKDICVQED